MDASFFPPVAARFIFHCMSLLPFHRVLIASAIVFCAGFSALELYDYAREGGTLELVLGIAFAAAAGALIVYLWHLRRILHLPRHRTDPRVPGRRPES